eukprot:5747588-Alexandrium_andersonii.AAC.1
MFVRSQRHAHTHTRTSKGVPTQQTVNTDTVRFKKVPTNRPNPCSRTVQTSACLCVCFARRDKGAVPPSNNAWTLGK